MEMKGLAEASGWWVLLGRLTYRVIADNRASCLFSCWHHTKGTLHSHMHLSSEYCVRTYRIGRVGYLNLPLTLYGKLRRLTLFIFSHSTIEAKQVAQTISKIESYHCTMYSHNSPDVRCIMHATHAVSDAVDEGHFWSALM